MYYAASSTTNRGSLRSSAANTMDLYANNSHKQVQIQYILCCSRFKQSTWVPQYICKLTETYQYSLLTFQDTLPMCSEIKLTKTQFEPSLFG